MARNPLDNRIFWREFLKRLSFLDPERDAELVADFCKTFNVSPENVHARLHAIMSVGLH